MGDKVKIESKIIVIPEGRVAFYHAVTPTYRTDKRGQPIKVKPDGTPAKPQYRMTWLLDPSNAAIQAVIKEIKDEAARQLDLFFNGRANWPKDNLTTGTKGIIPCFGNGNDLKKVYDGFRDMFYIKVADTVAPIIGDRRGRQVVLLSDNAWHIVDQEATKAKGVLTTTDETVPGAEVPYAGSFCRGRISLYVYNNEQAGVNGNFRSVQFLRPGPAFGGGVRRSVDEELAQLAGDAPAATGAASEADPW